MSKYRASDDSSAGGNAHGAPGFTAHGTTTSRRRRRLPVLLRRVVVGALGVLLAGGCAVQQELVLDGVRSGESEAAVELDELFVAYLVDLAGIAGEVPDDFSPFDIPTITETLHREAGVEVREVLIPEPQRLEISISIADIEEVFADLDDELVVVEEDGTSRTIELRLTHSILNRIIEMPFIAEEEAAQYLLPPEGMGKEEYIDYIAWALEEYEAERRATDVVRESRIRVRVFVPGTIDEIDGGRLVEGEDAAEFEVGVAEALTLSPDEELRYSVRYRP